MLIKRNISYILSLTGIITIFLSLISNIPLQYYIQVKGLLSTEFSKYENLKYGYKMLYPSDWQPEARSDGNIVSFQTSSNDPSGDLLTVTIDLNPGNQPFDVYIQKKISDEKKLYSDLNILKEEVTKLGGNTAYRLIYSLQDPVSEDMKIKTHIWTINNNTGYDFSNLVLLKSYSENLPMIQKLIDSFEFIPRMNIDADN